LTAGSAESALDLVRMSPRARQTWIDAYGVGYLEGIEAGRRQVEDELAAEWAALRGVVMPVVLRPPFDQLADRRGQHDRAAQQRAILRERGVVA